MVHRHVVNNAMETIVAGISVNGSTLVVALYKHYSRSLLWGFIAYCQSKMIDDWKKIIE